MADLASQIDELWARTAELTAPDRDALALVTEAIDLLDSGAARVAEIVDGEVVVHEWLKEAILLFFKLSSMESFEVGPYEYRDKVPLKHGYEAAGVRAVPGAIAARWGSFHEPGVILMPSYTNIGARLGADTMLDTWATAGSSAQIGQRVHIAGGVGIGGVLEPPQAAPVMIEDDVMLGSRCMVTQGARVRQGAVLGEGVILNRTIPVYDAETGEEVGRGDVPAWCIAVQSWIPKKFPGGEFGRPCVLVVKRYQPGEREILNDLLRDAGVSV